MRLRYGLLLGSALLVTGCDDDPAGPAFGALVTIDRSTYAASDTIVLTLANPTDDLFYVVACGSGFPMLVIDRRTDGEWEHGNATVCAGPTFVHVPMPPEATLIERYEAGVLLEPGTYRIGLYVSDDIERAVFQDAEIVHTRRFTVE